MESLYFLSAQCNTAWHADADYPSSAHLITTVTLGYYHYPQFTKELTIIHEPRLIALDIL